MYKCNICGQEYKEKPDFCDCGNDEFDLIEPQETLKEQEVQEVQKPEEKPQIQENKETPAVEQKENVQTSYNEYTQKKQYKSQNTDFIVKNAPSLIIFFICIILSILSIIYIGKNSGEKTEKEIKTISTSTVNIPDINTLWQENKKRKETVTTPVAAEKETKPIVKIIVPQQILPPKKTEQKTVSTVKNKQTQTNKTTPPVNKTIQTQTVKPSPKQTQTVTKNSQPQTQTQPKTQTQAQTQAKTAPAQTSDAEKLELRKYKIALRNKIASNINFATVVGDGHCIVTFKIAKSGQLTNRSFSKYSNNDSLNEAVYKGMMRTPVFNPPPAAYKDEMLKISVKMYGDNFEVDLP